MRLEEATNMQACTQKASQVRQIFLDIKFNVLDS